MRSSFVTKSYKSKQNLVKLEVSSVVKPTLTFELSVLGRVDFRQNSHDYYFWTVLALVP